MKIANKLFSQTLPVVIFAIIFASNAYANEVVGVWKTVDDKTLKVRSLIELRVENEKLFGKIIKVFPQPGQPKNPTCEMCKGELHNAPIVELQIINGLSLADDVWKDSTILDPDNGKTYNCRIWLEGDVLKVRGYIGFFYRTQEWLKYEIIQSDNDLGK